ncbi:chromate ion transporter-like protein [Saitoella complicata NRRL Y-17804]|uniref:chromate ion transporter-like protein n=1 Tax=Saitoella complicata (strain BCRC 22490 / CBS 7301 / JCM 7358 / NBRC 10748 / NRRL Y-17804) TaxID=698492 RepID=UPI000866A7C2|nr:chromate ion transporter-like protein [Saitoella complicata NRRL Y-17804]ODQ56152.1 chromate ion transporter-like protein [Saitoella complicata NRRL Y-17804]
METVANHELGSVEEEPRKPLLHRLVEVTRAYAPLGFTSFGGPGVHVILLRRLFVDKLQWVDETIFNDLYGLGNALPGPGSTQLAFSIALVRAGILGGLLAFLIWSLPGALGMLALGFGVRQIPEKLPGIVLALFTGLNAAAVGLIALAAYNLSASTITDYVTRVTLFVAAAISCCFEAQWLFPTMMVGGGLTTFIWDNERVQKVLRSIRRKNAPVEEATSVSASSQATPTTAINTYFTLSIFGGLAFLALFVVSLTLFLTLRSHLPHPPHTFDFFTSLYLAGTIIFGGGPVVIPLLRSYTVDPGWVAPRDFLLGFAILQAFPGPNFNFGVYLGVLAVPSNPVLGAFLGYLGIFAPGIILKLAILPVYARINKHPIFRSILRGVNAAAVGLLWTAVWRLWRVGWLVDAPGGVGTVGVSLDGDGWWGVVAAGTFVGCEWFKVPPAIAVVGGSVMGLVWYGVRAA